MGMGAGGHTNLAWAAASAGADETVAAGTGNDADEQTPWRDYSKEQVVYVKAGADGATRAISGDNTQLAYMVFPGKNAEYTAEAHVEDFTFDGWQIAGVPLAMSIDVDESDLSGNMGDLDKLKDGIEQVDDGASSLSEGAGSLKDGADQFVSGVGDVSDGVAQLFDGASTLADGAGSLADGANELSDGTSELRDQTSDLDSKVADGVRDGLADYLNPDFTPVDFVNGDADHITRVQFVIKTDGISAPDETDDTDADAVDDQAEQSFIDKLAALFR